MGGPMLEVMLILLAASVAMGLSVRFRVPSIPLMIGTGIVLGSLGWMGSVEDMQSLNAARQVAPGCWRWKLLVQTA